jgi:hypothetical protein
MAEIIEEFCSEFDHAIDALSKGEEGLFSKLPAWATCHRWIYLGMTEDSQGVMFRAEPAPDLDGDEVVLRRVPSRQSRTRRSAPVFLVGSLESDFALRWGAKGYGITADVRTVAGDLARAWSEIWISSDVSPVARSTPTLVSGAGQR